MNVELFFVKTNDRNTLIACIRARLNAPPDVAGKQPDWGLESSYDVLLAVESKRKIAVSPVKEGWVAGIESKEVLDFTLLKNISNRLKAEVIACQLASIVDSCGYVRFSSGQIVERKYLESVPDPLATVRAYFRTHFIPYDILSFREAIQLRSEGWEILAKGVM
jgi:hypothetical protein